MSLTDTTIALLQDLIQNGCVNYLTADSGQETKNADTLEAFFAGTDVRVERYEPHPGRVSIAFTVEGTDPSAEPLTLLGHTDVVPVDEDKWTHDPFGGEIVDGRVFGRGATDMLYITAAMAACVRDVARGERPRGTLTFVGCADEEARGGLGAAWLADHADFSWANCLSEEGGFHLPAADGSDALAVVVGEKGAGQRRLTVHGDAGHGSAPFGREMAVAKIAEVARRVAAIEPEVRADEIWEGYVRAWKFDPDTEAALLAGSGYDAFGQLESYSHAMSHLTISPTVLRAGGAINVLPSVAWMELDIRPLPGQTQDEIDELLRRLPWTEQVGSRVRDQGHLAMTGDHATAMQELRAVLMSREPLYARCQATVDTSDIPLDTMVERLPLPRWIILVPVSACWRWWVSATEWNSPTESSPSSTHDGYFQVIAEPVSTWVQEILEFLPRQSPRLVTKL